MRYSAILPLLLFYCLSCCAIANAYAEDTDSKINQALGEDFFNRLEALKKGQDITTIKEETNISTPQDFQPNNIIIPPITNESKPNTPTSSLSDANTERIATTKTNISADFIGPKTPEVLGPSVFLVPSVDVSKAPEIKKETIPVQQVLPNLISSETPRTFETKPETAKLAEKSTSGETNEPKHQDVNQGTQPTKATTTEKKTNKVIDKKKPKIDKKKNNIKPPVIPKEGADDMNIEHVKDDAFKLFDEDNIMNLDVAPRMIYDYDENVLPSNISKEEYSEGNSHLPKVFFRSKYSKLLFVAVTNDDLGLLKALLIKGADINITDSKNSHTPLMKAVLENKDRILKYLIIRGANIDKIDKSGRTALHLAIINKNATAFQMLVAAGALLDITDKYNKPPLEYIKDDNTVKSLVQGYKDMNDALISCSALGILDCVKIAVHNGADINYQNNTDHSTPLMIAAINGHKEIVNFLLVKGAEVNMRNKNDNNALELSRSRGYQEIANLIETSILKDELSISADDNVKPKRRKAEMYSSQPIM